MEATKSLYHTAIPTPCLAVDGRLLQPCASVRARAMTLSSIGRVSLPVKVFCWLGWYEPRSW